MFFFGAAASQKALRQKLQGAERRLLEYAKRYGDRSAGTYSMDTFDTPIPASSVPLRGLEDKDDLAIHGIRVINTTEGKKKSAELSKYPIVILHGYMNSSLNFYRNLVGLTNYFDTVFSLDFLGWGLSSRPKFRPQNTVEGAEDVFVESLEAWRRAQGVEKMVLAGHSMGGYLSVAYCERYPERVDELILLSPVGIPDEYTRQREGFSLMFAVWTTLYKWGWTPGSILRSLYQESGKRQVKRYVTARLPAITETDEREALADYLYYNSALSGSGEYALQKLLTPTLIARKPLMNRIPKLQGISQVSFLYGSHDWMDAGAAVQVQRLCSTNAAAPSVSVYQVPNSGHLLMLDNWQTFDAAIALAMGGLSSSSKEEIRKLEPTQTK